MKFIANSSIKTLIVALCLAQVPLSSALAQPRIKDGDTQETKIMNHQKKNCKSNSIVKSKSLINFILADILATYTHTGGGGITSIKEIATHTYEVSIAQEERMDVLTYELSNDEACTVKLLKKSESTISFGQ